MRNLTQVEQNGIAGGVDVALWIPIDESDDINFTNGFNFGVNLVGGILGFALGVPCSVVILPLKAIYTVGDNIIDVVT